MPTALVSATVFLVGLVTGADSAIAQNVLLAFSSERCGMCKTMEPTLKELERSGALIRHVDVGREPEFARRHGIRYTPTFIVWSGGRELTRLVGAQPAERLASALAMGAGGSLVPTTANLQNERSLNAPQTRLASTEALTAHTRAEAMPSVTLADAVERARAATVRLKVHDGRGFGVGTGTIIDRHGDEALVLTCGHLFRETKLQSRVEVELFVGGQIHTVLGQVVDYDSEDRDIGLVVIRPGFDVSVVKILPANEKPAAGQSVFSFGCDHGADPSRRDTRITAVDKYNQETFASNIEIAGAPVDGRSGGGLFDSLGRLIGVCNAADYDGDLGIYTGPGSIQWQLGRVQLSHLFEPSMQPHQNHAPVDRIASNQMVAGITPVQQPLGSSDREQEMIVVVRDPNNPTENRVMTIRNPSSELMGLISQQATP